MQDDDGKCENGADAFVKNTGKNARKIRGRMAEAGAA